MSGTTKPVQHPTLSPFGSCAADRDYFKSATLYTIFPGCWPFFISSKPFCTSSRPPISCTSSGCRSCQPIPMDRSVELVAHLQLSFFQQPGYQLQPLHMQRTMFRSALDQPLSHLNIFAKSGVCKHKLCLHLRSRKVTFGHKKADEVSAAGSECLLG
ncbi:hypothetical protein CALCODRAFT_23950 [Calocera cornea HHB12733]|uniref:Uncharacterized protein n=1 Tax=Calocera cornea HHB12733 TaxID=1353952 RepID=A0A165E4X5_9BASI|nr:hypothetical protein CALCODRAFT_23950 [Calocera cornea HHB12733]